MVRFQEADPEAIGPYRILRPLGAGGMGRVYLGVDTDGRLAAVKVVNTELLRDEEFHQRFTREAAATAAVTGRFIAGIVASDLDAPEPWLATEYIDGPSLSDVVTRNGALSPSGAQEMAAGLAEALTAIHAAGVVHRDVKPANVLLAAHGPHLIDFGIARDAAASTITRTGIVVGTPPYMAPEQIRGSGKIGPPADVFALGGVLTFAITARHPFGEGDPTSLAYRISHEEPDLDGIGDELIKALIASCLAKKPADRPTAPELQKRLGNVATRPMMPVVSSSPSLVTPTQPMKMAEMAEMAEMATELEVAADEQTGLDAAAEVPAPTDAQPTPMPAEPHAAGKPGPDDATPDPILLPSLDAPSADAASDADAAKTSAAGARALEAAVTKADLPPDPTTATGPNRRRLVAAALAAVLVVIVGAGVLGADLMHGGKKNPVRALGPTTVAGGSFPSASSSGSTSSIPTGTPTSSSSNPSPGPDSSSTPAGPSPTGQNSTSQSQPPDTVRISGQPDTVTTTASGHVTTLPVSSHSTSQPVKPPPTPPTTHGSPPPAPTGGSATMATNSTYNGFIVTFSWSAVPGATSYDVHYTYSSYPGSPPTVDQIINVTGTSYQRDYNNYPSNACFVVRAVNANGVSAWDSATPHCL